jgi:hypothetical protein
VDNDTETRQITKGINVLFGHLGAFQQRVKRWMAGASILQRMALFSALLAFLIMLVIALAQMVLALNPYQPVYAQVEALIDNQPDLESRLDYTTFVEQRLDADLDVAAARAFAEWYDGSTELQISSLASGYGDQSMEVRNLIRLMSDVAHEIRRLDNSLQGASASDRLIQDISQVRLYPDRIDPDLLQSIHEAEPDEVNAINDLRGQLQVLDTQARAISENSSAVQTLALLQAGAGEQPEPVALMVDGYASWQDIPQGCQSLEIQFSNTVATLSQVYQTIDVAWRSDRNWGYSFWAPAASWVNRSIVWLAVIVMLLIGFMLVGLFWKRAPAPGQVEKKPAFNVTRWAQTRFTQLVEGRARLSGGGSQNFLEEARTLVRRLVEAPEEPAPVVRKSSPTAARLVLIQPNGQKEEKRLPDEGIFRIGSDPSFQLPIDYSRAAYVELWIRKARSGYFLEVMFSEEPVLVNNKAVSAARALKHGDLIELKEITIIYLEH